MPKVHQQIRSYCRDQARRIIATDRQARKYGVSHNTVGAIENAMIKAYRMGMAGIGDADRLPLDDKIRWDDLPPRARDLLWRATFRRSLATKAPPIELQRLMISGKPRWFVFQPEGLSKTSFANCSVTALQKHSMLVPVEGEPDRFVLSEDCRAICRDYWRRRDEGDPTLPKM